MGKLESTFQKELMDEIDKKIKAYLSEIKEIYNHGSFRISNRIFEAILYNYFITASQIQNANRKHI